MMIYYKMTEENEDKEIIYNNHIDDDLCVDCQRPPMECNEEMKKTDNIRKCGECKKSLCYKCSGIYRIYFTKFICKGCYEKDIEQSNKLKGKEERVYYYTSYTDDDLR